MKDADDDDFSATTVSAGQLRAIVERIERLEEEKKEVSEQIKEVYAEAKGNGFDAKTIRKIVALRKKKPEERSEEEAMLELYMNALGMLPGSSARAEPPLDWSEPLPVQQRGRKPLTPTVVPGPEA